MRGARPRSPAATSSVISATRAKPSWNAAQCSRSAAWRKTSPIFAGSQPHAPCVTASLKASAWCSPGASRNGSEVPIRRWSTSPRIRSSSQASLLGVQDRAVVGVELAGRPRVHDDQSRLGVEVAGVAPPVARRFLVGPLGQLVEDRRRDVQLLVAVVLGDGLPQRVVLAVVRPEVPQVLVDPVRREPPDDPVVPPRLPLHLLPPRPAGVPVVADVVVVEDHRAGQRREQPPVRGVAPGQLVEVGVLLEVLDLLARRLVGSPRGPR